MRHLLLRHRLAAASFVVAAAYVPGIFSPAFSPRWWAIAVLLPLASDLDPRALPRVVAVPLLAGLAWAAASLLWTPSPVEASLDLFLLALLCLALAAAAGAEDVDPAVEAFGWGVAVSSAFAVAQAAGYPLGTQGAGPVGLFMNSEVLAETAAPVAAWALLRRRWPLFAASVLPLALCGSRIAVVAALAGLALAWRPRLGWAQVFALALLALSAATSLVIFGAGKFQTGMDRLVLWDAAVRSLSFQGLGLGWWAAGHLGMIEEFAHSDALQLLVELGAGALPLLAVPAIVLLKGDRDAAARAAFVCLCFEAAVSFPLHLPATAFLAALLAGRLVGRRHSVRVRELGGGALPLRDARRAPSFPRGVGERGHAVACDVPLREARPEVRAGDLEALARGVG